MEPIDLVALRAEAEATALAGETEIRTEHLLALIDAVEAATAWLTKSEAESIKYPGLSDYEYLDALQQALTPFL